ncbi:hypothetical protein [Streptomyces sp. NPDC048845]|uniref:hypothetical protein n=1 Tax=Streptomyces sp. NPDC048845 TaxID=3155390 RepID=UPI00341CC67B
MKTPIWQFSVRPAVPEYWRWTPAEVVPFLTTPVSSTIRMPSASPSLSAMYAQVVADVIGLPLRSGKEVLQAVGRGVADLFGQLPAVLAGHRGEQPAYVVTHATAELDSAEAVPDGQEEIVQFEVPLRGGVLGDHPRRLPRRCHCSVSRPPGRELTRRPPARAWPAGSEGSAGSAESVGSAPEGGGPALVLSRSGFAELQGVVRLPAEDDLARTGVGGP